MKKTLTSMTVAVLALFGAQAALAQAASSPSRAEVKAATAEANKKGQIASGDAPAAAPIGTKSDKSRADEKAATAAANKKGTIASGDAPAAAPLGTKSDTARADVKKETAAANKKGEIPGTGTGPSAELPKK
jgi:hypothetical protein